MELFAATARETVLTACCNSAFSQENFTISVTFLSFSKMAVLFSQIKS